MNTDFLLIKKMKQGDDAALDSFVHKYYNDILLYCRCHCIDKECAWDLTQETFVHFFTKLPDYHYTGKTKNYLYTIARNLCCDFYRKSKEIPLAESKLYERTWADGQSMEPIENLLEQLSFEWALKQIPDDLRDVVILYYFQELKLTEIADKMQISLPLVKYRLRRAKMKLKELFRKEELYEYEKIIERS